MIMHNKAMVHLRQRQVSAGPSGSLQKHTCEHNISVCTSVIYSILSPNNSEIVLKNKLLFVSYGFFFVCTYAHKEGRI